jgi:PIN domain nuclease of toxin-antitoxin system
LRGITPEALPDTAISQGFGLIHLDARTAAGFSSLPVLPKHRDPFDRMLIWQAISLNHVLISCDRKIESNALTGLKVLW